MTLKTIEGTFIAPQGKYALVVGRFNSFVVESLVSGAVDALVRHGVKESDITIIRAPGAFEIPLVTQKVAQRGEFAAIDTALARLQPGDLCLVLVDQVEAALAHLAQRCASQA